MGSFGLNVINDNKLTKNKRLDLGKCGLTRFPSEVLSCVWLEELILSNEWWDHQEGMWRQSANKGKYNNIGSIPSSIGKLVNLRVLIIGKEIRTDRPRLLGLNNIYTLKNLEKLDLSFCNIRHLYRIPLSSKLTHLNLRGTGIKYFSRLAAARNLKFLDLSNNHVSGLSELKYLYELEELILNDCIITRPELLGRITSLKRLSISSSRIDQGGFLRRLVELSFLDISNNPIRRFSFLKTLAGLEYLDISCNFISGLKVLKGLDQLQVLKMNGAELGELSWPGTPDKLEILEIAMVERFDYSAVNSLKNLKKIRLGFNRLGEISFTESLDNLESIDLRHNLLKDIRQLFPLSGLLHLKDVELANNPILSQFPAAVQREGWKAMRERIIAIRDNDEFVEIKEVKMLLLGNPNVGKSNLMEYLHTGCEPLQEHPTHGVKYSIIEGFVEDTIINCWDFGGDEYFHATHQLFFSPNAINVILWSEITVKRNDDDVVYEVDYWMRAVEKIIQIQQMGDGEDDVVLCENKLDLNNWRDGGLDHRYYREKFPDLELSFAKINLKPLRFTGDFAELIKSLARKRFIRYQKVYARYLSVIRNTDSPILDVSQVDVGQQDQVELAVRIFRNMGILLYFDQIIPGKIFTKPQELLEFLYNRILSKELLIQGRYYLNRSEILESISDNSLGLNDSEVIALLSHFDLVFKIPQADDLYFFPQYMRSPNRLLAEMLRHNYQFAAVTLTSDAYLLHIGMLKIYQQYGRFVAEQGDRTYFFWKDAIIIEKDNGKVLIQLDRENNAITIFPWIKRKSSALIHELVQFIITLDPAKSNGDIIHNSESDWAGGELLWEDSVFQVFLHDQSGNLVNWSDLKQVLDLGGTQIIAFPDLPSYRTSLVNRPQKIRQNSDKVILCPVKNFNGYLPDHAVKIRKKSVFICYPHTEMAMKNDLLSYLKNLERSGLIDVWDDGKITAGEWNRQIFDSLVKVDICIVLVSQQLINSEYVNDIELNIIAQKTLERKCSIIPVLLKECDWQNWNIYPNPSLGFEGVTGALQMNNFQFFPFDDYRKVYPLAEQDRQAKAWLQIVDEIRAICSG